jgi:hypothetical protein
MRFTALALVTVLASLAAAACTTTTTTGSGTDPARASDDGGAAADAPAADGQATSPATPPPASSHEANVELGGTCASFTPCGGAPQGTFDYSEGCIASAASAVKAQCPTVDTSGLKVTVRGSLHFAGSALTRDAVATTSGTIVLPATCTQGQCKAVEQALATAFDTVTCTGAAACTCTVQRVDTTKDATSFTVNGTTLTTADGDSYGICVSGSSLAYQGRSAGAEDGVWTLTRR